MPFEFDYGTRACHSKDYVARKSGLRPGQERVYEKTGGVAEDYVEDFFVKPDAVMAMRTAFVVGIF